jgi:hypothetical protein
MRFQVLTAASMKMAIFWAVAPCSLVEVYRRFRGACCLHHQGALMWRQQVRWIDWQVLRRLAEGC